MAFKNRIFTKNKTQALLAIVVLGLFLLLSPNVKAAQLQSRSVSIDNPEANAVTNHDFTFTTRTNSLTGSIVFEYCDNSALFGIVCNPPPGLDVSSVNIASQSGITGFSVDAATTADRLVISRVAAVEAPVAASYSFTNAINQNAAEDTVFVRISIHASTDGSGPYSDNGSVAFSTTEGVAIGGTVPPYLAFCAGAFVALDCTSTTGSLLAFGELSSVNPSTVTSQFSTFTNDPTGYIVYLNGSTMTSGSRIINPLASTQTSSIGSSQFGINLRANSIPTVGANGFGVGTGVPTANYNTPNNFRFVDGEAIASSPLPTYPNRFTVSYLVNVPNGQAPGVYAAIVNYTAVASF